MKVMKVMKVMKQLSLTETAFLPKTSKQICRAVFLVKMETVLPWPRLEAFVEQSYHGKVKGGSLIPLGTMLRILSVMRAVVENSFRMIKQQFGFAKSQHEYELAA